MRALLSRYLDRTLPDVRRLDEMIFHGRPTRAAGAIGTIPRGASEAVRFVCRAVDARAPFI